MPLTSMIIRHVCVEGWAAIVQMGMATGTKLAQPANATLSLLMLPSWDLASALHHPQTLMVYQKNGQPCRLTMVRLFV